MSEEEGTAAHSVRREDGKVWIEGMEGVNWGGSFFKREDSQVRCLVEALQCAGQDVTYAEAMGLSGAAFKLTMAPNLFVAEIHSEMGMDWTEIVPRIWGVEYDWQAISLNDEENPDWPDQLHRAAVESIDRGLPLFYMNGEWNLLVGYREDESAFIIMPYAGDESGYQESARPKGFVGEAWFASVLRQAGEPAGRRESVVRSLRDAVELATKPAEKEGQRNFGYGAYEVWIAALEEAREDASLHGNAFSYSQLLTSRQAAADYLRVVAGELGGDAEGPLLAAAERYEAIAGCLMAGKDCVMWPWEENWTPENRAWEARLLRESLADEKEAVTQIEAALAALGEEASASGGSGLDGGDGAGAAPQRLVLEDVPPAKYGDPGHHPFGVCLASLLTHAGVDWKWSDILGYSGAGFRMTWNYRKWDEGNMDLGIYGAAPMRRGIQAFGFRPRFLIRDSWWRGEGGDDVELIADGEVEARFREAIVASIARGMPVLALGVVGPPEVAIVTGYDGGGDVLIGWSCFQGEHPQDQLEPSGAFRQREWVGNTQGIIVLEEGLAADEVQRAREGALEWAYRIATREPARSHVYGLAAYEGWAAGTADDAAFPADEAETLQSRRYTIWDGLIMLADRGPAATFLEEQAGKRSKGSDELLAAATAFRADGELGGRIAEAFGGPRLSSDELLASTEARATAREAILEARDRHEEGLHHLREALVALGATVEELPQPIVHPPPAELPQKSTPHMLQGLEFPKWAISELGCTHACLTHLGVEISRPWLYGGTARAFLINIHEDVDVEAVTAYHRQRLLDLSPNLGFRVEGFMVSKDETTEDSYRERQREAWSFARSRLGRSIPCYGWELKAPYGDYWLITGFDDVGYYYAGWETGGPTPWQKLGDQFIPVLDMRSVVPIEAASDEVVVREAFETAIWLAEHPKEWTVDDDAHGGPDAFDAWATSLETGRALHNHHAYNALAWHETREMAVAFLVEARGRLGRGDLDPLFGEAAEHYGTVRDHLAAVKARYPMPKEGEGWDNESTVTDPEMGAALRQAGLAEREGLAVLGKIAAALE